LPLLSSSICHIRSRNERERENGLNRRKQEGRERKVSRATAAAAADAIILLLFFLQFNIKEYNEKRVQQETRENN